MIIRLHRRDPAYANGFFDPNDAGWKLNEKKKNIFWAVYSLDRLASFIISQPHSIRDADIDVDVSAILTPTWCIVDSLLYAVTGGAFLSQRLCWQV